MSRAKLALTSRALNSVALQQAFIIPKAQALEWHQLNISCTRPLYDVRMATGYSGKDNHRPSTCWWIQCLAEHGTVAQNPGIKYRAWISYKILESATCMACIFMVGKSLHSSVTPVVLVPGGLILRWHPSMAPAAWTKAGLCKLTEVLCYLWQLIQSLEIPNTELQTGKAHQPSCKLRPAHLSPGPSCMFLKKKVFLANNATLGLVRWKSLFRQPLNLHINKEWGQQ